MVPHTLVIATLVLLTLSGCHTRHAEGPPSAAVAEAPPAPAAPAAPVYAEPQGPAPDTGVVAAPPYYLDSGDQVRVVVFGQENLSSTYAIDGAGYLSIPLIGAVPARGATTFDLEKRIASQLRKKYVRDPKVTAEIAAYRPFFILGEVRRAGQYPYVNGMTVQTAVALAGGYTERARESEVRLTRRFGEHAETETVAADFVVQPGDTIYVRERFF